LDKNKFHASGLKCLLKFSTGYASRLSSLAFFLLLLINYQAISQDNNESADDTASAFLPGDNESDSSAISGEKQLIYYFKLHEDIMPAAARLVDDAVNEATAQGADVIIMELDTYGGRVDIADSIRGKLLNARPLTVSYIINNAASAGALISIACDSIYMKESATIGAVTVVNQTGEQLPDKYQSYMRSKMRATAEAQERDPDIAEAMVDERIALEGIVDSGEVLTFTASEAVRHNFCDGIVNSLKDVLAELGIEQYEIVEHEISGMDKVIGFLLNPIVSSLLMLMIFGGIYFELQTPGVGFPLAAAIIGAVLYFAPLYLEGLAEHWEIVLFFVGIILIGVEIFALPGFGVAGSAGIALIIGSLTLSLIGNDFFDFSMTGADKIGFALLRVILTLFAGLAMLVMFGGSIFNSAAFQRITLQDEQRSEAGYTIGKNEFYEVLGKEGKAVTDLRPAGKVEIDGEIYDAMSEGGYIERDSEIVVRQLEANTLIVRKNSPSVA
jgi:membrane-bound serine protease (ClpP class)